MSEKTIDANALPVLSSVDDSRNLLVTGPSAGRVSVAKLREAIMGKLSLQMVMDNVFIMYHGSDGHPRLVKPHRWPAQQTSGEVADGVAIIEGGKVLVVAPTEADSTGLRWSSAAMSGGAVMTSNVTTAVDDWAGKANTVAIINGHNWDETGDPALFAPGFCNRYSNGGLDIGKWWLPSLGELMMISANMTKINYALSLITGATPIAESYYWSSTEYNATYAWVLSLSAAGVVNGYTKASGKYHVRPVSAFIK